MISKWGYPEFIVLFAWMRVRSMQVRWVSSFSRCLGGRMLRFEWDWRGKGHRMNGRPNQVTRATYSPMREPDRTCWRGAVFKAVHHAWSILSKLPRGQALLMSMASILVVTLPHCMRGVLAPLASILLVRWINFELLTMVPWLAIFLRHIMLDVSCGWGKVSLVSTAHQSGISVSYRPVIVELLVPISCLGAWRIGGVRIDLWDLIDLRCWWSSMHDHLRVYV